MCLEQDGFSWSTISSNGIQPILKECESILEKSKQKFGVRDVLSKSSTLLRLAQDYLLPIAQASLSEQAFIVRSTLFDKPSDANWTVPWHQDVTIEVQEPYELDGFGPWTTKEGLLSVQPPTSVLEQMITLRLHLDPVDETNGVLWVDPASHQKGKLRIGDIQPTAPHPCCGEAGSVLQMKPLLFHASHRSTSNRPRRVLHLDFAYQELPSPLRWRDIGLSISQGEAFE